MQSCLRLCWHALGFVLCPSRRLARLQPCMSFTRPCPSIPILITRLLATSLLQMDVSAAVISAKQCKHRNHLLDSCAWPAAHVHACSCVLACIVHYTRNEAFISASCVVFIHSSHCNCGSTQCTSPAHHVTLRTNATTTPAHANIQPRLTHVHA